MTTTIKKFDPARMRNNGGYLYSLPPGHTLADTLQPGYFTTHYTDSTSFYEEFVPKLGTSIAIGRKKTFIGVLGVESNHSGRQPAGVPVKVYQMTNGPQFNAGKEIIETRGLFF